MWRIFGFGLGLMIVMSFTTPSLAQTYNIKILLATQPDKIYEAPCIGNQSSCAATLYIPFESCADGQLTLGFKINGYRVSGLFLCGKRLLSTQPQGRSDFYTNLKYDAEYEHSLNLYLTDPAFDDDSSALAVIRPYGRFLGNIALIFEIKP